ncbi:hypothetical protein [Chroococcidiopsis sp.]|uniref:hypothetical protein n=1 Tax=Chroococcidiopsis sp. TaxID=3088168 RepID=UPI003F3FFE27
MPYTLELEQAAQQAQDRSHQSFLEVASRKAASAIEAFFLDGVHDGFDGIKPQYSEIVYLQGYCQGMRNFSAQMQRDAALLEYEGQEVERAAIAIPF